MADAFPSLSRWGRWAIRTEPRWDMVGALIFLAIPVLIVIFVAVAVLVFLVVLLIEAVA